ncbi:hypothetical protein [Mucilaginibacter xinganensis]|uniref:CDP-Glycerol:Poly(Glycerophosphate) glycerophosphotransferase n=1 Tax=Mucilaginibacter xinganensis TaxID=1234841 RepID=A0A223NZY6_9SPHI|nr:hypothetical protein [Mucilaginibacter xinganensis]ASU35141.1 hypothetical protein MuYL_3256 [Mucilaginibacter xinganensis]
MEFDKREKLIGFLKRIERTYPIDKWTHNGINLWPVIKISIFFINYSAIKTAKSATLKSRMVSVFKSLKLDALYSFYWFKKIKVNEAKYVFSGFSRHRVMWKESFYNRYFDPMMDYIDEVQGEKSIILEYDNKIEKSYYKPERVHYPVRLFHYFNFTTKKVKFEYQQLERFDELLAEIKQETDVDTEKLISRISAELTGVSSWKSLWAYLLAQIKPSYVFVLCYYNSPMYGLILAAREKGIKTIDMQHGGQGPFHSAYNYERITGNKWDLFPDYFWTWDRSSADNIEKFTKNTSHLSFLGGNPWIAYLRDQNFELTKNGKKIIIYTLQTNFVPVLHSYIIDAIKESTGDYVWWLRLHPRMAESEINELHQTLKNENINDKVEVERATALPLPVILSNCVAHVSHFSGSVVEAALMNVAVNIVMGDIGKKFFKEVIDQDEALFFDTNADTNLFAFIKEHEKANLKRGNGRDEEINYKHGLQYFN